METTNVTADAVKPANNDYQTLDEFMAETETLLINALLPDVLPLLKKRGYPQEVITAKQAELKALKTLNEKQQKEYGEQYAATEAYTETKKGLHRPYMQHLELSRMVFKEDTTAKTALGTKGRRKQSQSGYATQALQFYNGALESQPYQDALATKGIEKEELQAAQTGYKSLGQLAAAQVKETGEAQEATANRDAAYDTLADWMSEFKATATIALAQTPQLMVKLGLR